MKLHVKLVNLTIEAVTVVVLLLRFLLSTVLHLSFVTFFLCVHLFFCVSFSCHFSFCCCCFCDCFFCPKFEKLRIETKHRHTSFRSPKLPWDCNFEKQLPPAVPIVEIVILILNYFIHIWKQKSSYCIHKMENAARRNCGQRAKLFRILFRSIYHLDTATEQRSLPYGGFEKHVQAASWWTWREPLRKEINLNLKKILLLAEQWERSY